MRSRRRLTFDRLERRDCPGFIIAVDPPYVSETPPTLAPWTEPTIPYTDPFAPPPPGPGEIKTQLLNAQDPH
jgi:hypothetical protein